LHALRERALARQAHRDWWVCSVAPGAASTRQTEAESDAPLVANIH
jgi:hypothetical protein